MLLAPQFAPPLQLAYYLLMEEADKRRRPCTKRFRLALWWLTYRLPVLDGVNKETEELPRKHCKHCKHWKHCKYSKQDWARDQVSAQLSAWPSG